MSFLPIAYDISGGYILMLGNNEDVLKKIKRLAPYTTDILVVNPEICKEISDSGVKIEQREFCERHLDGAVILYDYSEKDNRDIWEMARNRGVLVNVHDDPKNCDFVSPAIYRHGDMSVAVSSNAKNVCKSIKWRNLIRDFFKDILASGEK